MVRNLAWGLLSVFWVAGLISIVVLVLFVFSGDARQQVAEMGGPFRLAFGYAAAAIACGATIGIFRPLTRYRWGTIILGALLCMEAFGALLLATIPGNEMAGEMARLREHGVGLATAFALVGAIFGPIWASGVRSGKLWLPDFDRSINELFHGESLDSGTGDNDGAA